MTDCVELATRLGQAIASSPQAATFRAAREALEAQDETMQALDEYQKQMQKVAELEQEAKPVEVADKARLRELNDKLISCDEFKKFTAAQVEYVDLMRKVNDALRKELAETEG